MNLCVILCECTDLAPPVCLAPNGLRIREVVTLRSPEGCLLIYIFGTERGCYPRA